MKIGVVMYIHHKDSILLVNWKKYGCWCGVGGYLEEQGNSIYEVATNVAKELCGITPEIINLKGIFTFECNGYSPEADCSLKEYILECRTNSPIIRINKKLNNAKWVPIKKVLNYKLYPNSDRYLLNTYLKTKNYFELRLEYSNIGITQTLETIF